MIVASHEVNMMSEKFNNTRKVCSSLKLFTFLLLTISSLTLRAHADEHEDHEHYLQDVQDDRRTHQNSPEDHRKCAKLRKAMKIWDAYRINELHFCSGFAYANIGDFYETALHFAYRAFEQNPEDVGNLTNIIWWEWSRYNDYLDILPGDVGKDGLKKALAIAKRAMENPELAADVNYNFQLARMTSNLARFYNTEKKAHEIRPDFMAFTKARYVMVERNEAASIDQKLRARLSLGHIARFAGNVEASQRWYEKAIELAPQDVRIHNNMALLVSARN